MLCRPGVHFPRPAQGCSIKEMGVLDSNGVDRDALVAEISKAFALQIHLLGKWSGDPHPGNILVQLERRNGASRKSAPWRPVLIDFGITVTLTDGQRLGFCRTVCAAAESDSFSLLQSFADMGIVLNRADPQASMDMIRHLFRSTASREDTRRQSKEFMERAKARDDASAESGIAVDRRDEPATERREARDGGRADENGSPPSSVLRRRHGKATTAPAANAGSPSTRRNPVDAYPGFLVFLFRTLGLLRGLSTRLGVEHAYLPIMYKVAQRALREAVPPSERMQSVVYPAAGGEWQPGSAASLESRRGKRLRKIVARVIVELERRELLIGCQVAAFVDGKIVLDVAAGRVGKHNARPVTPSTLFCCFSATKGVCAILFAELADEHGIDRDDLVGKWWPEFACKGKEATTVGMLLSHRAGLSTAAPEDMRMGRLRDDWQGIVDWLASDAKPSHPPGQRTAYHALNFGWLVAGLLQQVSGGESIQCRLNALAATLGIAGEAYIGLPKDLCRDVPTSRVAMLKSDIYADIARILKVRRRGRTSGGGESDGEAADAAHVQGENVDALYGNSSSAEANAMKFVFEEILTQGIDPRSGGGPQPRARDAPEAAGAAAAARTSAQPEGGDAGSATGAGLSDLFAKTPYLVDPAFFAHPVLREAVVPAANGHFSARALAKMYAVLAQDGVVDGKHVLRPGRAALMMETERAPGAAADADESSDAFGAGVRVYNCLDRRGRKVSAKAMGHQGIGGSVAFCVPTSNFSVAFTCNQLNAFSVAGAVLISTVCAVLDVPTPAAYAGLMQKLRGDGVNSLEAALDSIDGEIEAALDRFDAPQMFTG
jgi:aarF domain-containing kinase